MGISTMVIAIKFAIEWHWYIYYNFCGGSRGHPAPCSQATKTHHSTPCFCKPGPDVLYSPIQGWYLTMTDEPKARFICMDPQCGSRAKLMRSINFWCQMYRYAFMSNNNSCLLCKYTTKCERNRASKLIIIKISNNTWNAKLCSFSGKHWHCFTKHSILFFDFKTCCSLEQNFAFTKIITAMISKGLPGILVKNAEKATFTDTWQEIIV